MSNIKPVVKLTFCAIISALSTAVMLAGYLGVATYAAAAIAGLLFIAPVIEVGKTRAFCCYLVTSALALVFAEPYTKVIFIAFFGYYPVLKSVLDNIKNTVLSYTLKLLTFNAAAVAAYFFASRVLKLLPSGGRVLPAWLIAVAAVIAQIVFIAYDYGISGVANVYMRRLHQPIQKLLEGRR